MSRPAVIDTPTIAAVAVCRVPTSRIDEIVRDAEAAMNGTRSRVTSGAITVIAAGVSAGVANEVSDSTALVVAVTIGGLLFAYGLVWLVAVIRVGFHPRRTRHWRSQVYQAAPECVEFDLLSECHHDIAAARVEVVEPDGGVVQHEQTRIPVERGEVGRGSYVSVGNFPQRFPAASPLVESDNYTVVWYGQWRADSRWMEIGRQRFNVPVPGGKVVQARE
jgi:hypothetical protein